MASAETKLSLLFLSNWINKELITSQSQAVMASIQWFNIYQIRISCEKPQVVMCVYMYLRLQV